MKRMIIAALIALNAAWVGAVEPSEVLDDPTLEARAREISKELRCLVCRNENIDASDAAIAKDLRILVRERLQAGDSDTQVIAYIVDRYGEFVLLRPPLNGSNLALYLAGPLALIFGIAIWFAASRRRDEDHADALSADEAKRLAELLDD